VGALLTKTRGEQTESNETTRKETTSNASRHGGVGGRAFKTVRSRLRGGRDKNTKRREGRESGMMGWAIPLCLLLEAS